MGCVGGANTLGAESEEPGWLLLLIRVSSAMGLVPQERPAVSLRGENKAVSNACEGLVSAARCRALDVILWE